MSPDMARCPPGNKTPPSVESHLLAAAALLLLLLLLLKKPAHAGHGGSTFLSLTGTWRISVFVAKQNSFFTDVIAGSLGTVNGFQPFWKLPATWASTYSSSLGGPEHGGAASQIPGT